MNAIDLSFKIRRVTFEKVLQKSYERQKRRFKRNWRRYLFLLVFVLSLLVYATENYSLPPLYLIDLKWWIGLSLLTTILLIFATYRILKSAEILGQLKNMAGYLSMNKIKKDQWLGDAKLSIDQNAIRFERAKFKVGFKWAEQKRFRMYPHTDYLLLTWPEDQLLFVLQECMTEREFDQVEKLIHLHRGRWAVSSEQIPPLSS